MFPVLTVDQVFGMTLGEFFLTALVVIVVLAVLFWVLRNLHVI
jgi:hypothetical protein